MPFLRHLAPRGVLPAKKTLTVQLVCLFLVSIFDLAADIISVQFAYQCNDYEYDTSYAGIITRSLDMIVLLLWRVITFTMFIVFLRQARHLFPNEYKSIEKEIRQAFALKDDTLLKSNSDEENEYDSESEASSSSREIPVAAMERL